MRISFRGNDEGAALLISVILILVFSYLFMSYAPFVATYQRHAISAKKTALENIEKNNMEVVKKYDIH